MSVLNPEMEFREEIPEEVVEVEAIIPPPKPPQAPERLAIAPPPPRPGKHEKASSGAGGKRANDTPPPRIRPPDFSEWHDYLGNFALRWAARGYIAFVFRGIDRYELLAPEDNEALELDPEELSDIAKPIAHLADRSRFGKRYGRVIVDSSDGIAAAIQLGMWGARVNRIAKKVRKQLENGTVSAGPTGNVVSEEAGEAQENVVNLRPGPTGFGYN